MGRVLKLMVGLLGAGVVGAALIVFQASMAAPAECPSDRTPSMGLIQIGLALNTRGVVTITNADATAIGGAMAGDAVEDLRVCFDTRGGHASGKMPIGPLVVPFYATAYRVDLSARTPRVTEFDLQLGLLPAAAANLVEPRVIASINENLETIQLNRRYSYQLGNGTLTIRAD